MIDDLEIELDPEGEMNEGDLFSDDSLLLEDEKKCTQREILYQGATLATSSFTGTVCSFDSTNNVVSLINTEGSYSLSAPVYGNSSGTSRTLLNYSPTSFNVGSGYMMYIENRQPVQRSANGNEQHRLVLRF
jgi:hypothetical protein